MVLFTAHTGIAIYIYYILYMRVYVSSLFDMSHVRGAGRGVSFRPLKFGKGSDKENDFI